MKFATTFTAVTSSANTTFSFRSCFSLSSCPRTVETGRSSCDQKKQPNNRQRLSRHFPNDVHSLLVAAVEVDTRDLPLVAADEVPVGAGFAGLAVVAVPADADDGAFLERLSDLVGA